VHWKEHTFVAVQAEQDLGSCVVLVTLQALDFYEKLQVLAEFSHPELWSKMAACRRALGNDDGAIDIYLKVLNGEQSNLQRRSSTLFLENICGPLRLFLESKKKFYSPCIVRV
jgi:hypothetical protein